MYKFKSQSAADVIMLSPTGDRVLGLLGRHVAARGIIEVADMPAVIDTLMAAIAADEALRQARAAGIESAEPTGSADDAEAAAPLDAISLRQRAWPLVEMMKRSLPEGHPVVWGV